MRSINERLIASDPAATGYEHPRFGAMVARVVATPASRRDTAWRSFRLKVAAAGAISGVVTGTGIAALSTAGISLPVLSLAATSGPLPGFAASTGKQSGDTATKYTAAPMMIRPRNFEFTGAGNFSSLAGSAAVYSLSAPSNPAATLTGAAAALNITLGAPTSNGNGQDYSAAGPLYAGWIGTVTGFSYWEIGINKQPGSTSPPGVSAPVSFGAMALADAHRLSTFDVGAPTSDQSSSGSSERIEVTVPIMVGGRPTDFLYDFIFAADGTLVSATGVSFSAAPLGDYPLISPASGVDQITAQFDVSTAPLSGFGSYSGVTATGTGSAGSGAPVTPPTVVNGSSSAGSAPPDTTPSSSSPTSTVETTTTTLPPLIVNLTSVADQYGAYAMANGSTLLLPIYIYSGHDVDTQVPETFRVISVDPRYLDLALAVRPQIY